MNTYGFRIVEEIRDAIFVVNAKRDVIYANPAARTRFGSESLSRNFAHVVRHPDCLTAVDKVLEGVERANAVISIEREITTIFEVDVISLEGEHSDGAEAAVILHDVTQIDAANQMRSDFVANVSHELRSPLTALSGFIETLQGPAKDDEEARIHFLNLMEREASRMNGLISDLLSLSRVEAEERIRPSGSTSIEPLINQVISTLGLEAEKENKTFETSFAGNLPPIRGEGEELLHIFQNLIENAVRYGAKGTAVKIEANAMLQTAGIVGPVISVAIADEGEGIARPHLARLTERFYRVDKGRSRDKGGTGLGLAIVKHIIQRHRGRLQIESEPGKGSRFTVFLPAAP